ncbi:MAG: hypothetical protein V3V08_11750 [Nannocystaceae bacterium]
MASACTEHDPCAGRGEIGVDGTCVCDLPYGGDGCRGCAEYHFGPACDPCPPQPCVAPKVCDDGALGGGACVCPQGFTDHEDGGCILVDRCGCGPDESCAAGRVEAEGHICMQLAQLRADPIYMGDVLSCGIRLSWTSLNVGGPVVDRFNVYRDGILIGSAPHPLFEDWAATPATAHTYEVTAVDTLGVESSLSWPAIPVAQACSPGLDRMPHLVRNASVELIKNRCNSSQVRWDGPSQSEEVTGFWVYLNGQPVHKVGPSSGAFGGIDGISPLARYRYAFAPVYGPEVDRVGPLVEVDLEPGDCHELPHVGRVRAVVFLVRFSDYASEAPFDVAYVRRVLEGGSHSAAAYLHRVSYGRQTMDVAEVFDWIDLSAPSTDYCDGTGEQEGQTYGFFPSCDTHRIAAASRSVAAGNSEYEPGDFLTQFDRQIYVLYGVTQGAYGGGSALWVSSFYTVTEPIVHELGHTFGMKHAGNWECPNMVGPSLRDVWAGECEAWIYGDAIDVMAVRLRHYSAYNKLIAGYLSPAQVVSARQSSEFVLTALEAQDPGSEPVLLTIPLDNGTFYFVEYRVPVDFDDNSSFPSYSVLTETRPEIERGLAVWLRAQSLGENIRQVSVSAQGRFVTPDHDFYDPYRRIRIRNLEELAGERIRLSVAFGSE